VIEITERPISPELVVNKIKTDGSGCVVTYVGLIRNHSHSKQVLSVEYKDSKGAAENELQEIANKIRQKWQINNTRMVAYGLKRNNTDLGAAIFFALL